MDELTKLLNKQNKDLLTQRDKLIKDMQNSLSKLVSPLPSEDKFTLILERLDGIEGSLADLKVIQHRPLEPTT